MTDRHDWQRLIAEVREMYRLVHGRRLTDYKLGVEIEAGHETVAILAERGEPRYVAGQLLLALHSELLRKSGRTAACP